MSYSKDYNLIRKFVEKAVENPSEFLECAAKYTVHKGLIPDSLLLGFSPQPLIASLALAGRVKYVITSLEVLEGKIPPARFSHTILETYKDRIDEIIVSAMAPSPSKPPVKVVEELVGRLSGIQVGVMDISGGTQLAAIAVYVAGIRRLTYTYPDGRNLVIYPLLMAG